MGKYQHDMNGEDKVIFEMSDGWHDFEIVKVEEKMSKQGNQMFLVKVVSTEDYGTGTDVYLVAEKGKRWFLKQLLKACDCPAGEDGVYDWSEEDVEGHTVSGRVEHQQDKPWTDRNNVEQPGKLKARIVEFKKLEVK
jgi:hypothetical protein